jgi:hypothetical protein
MSEYQYYEFQAIDRPLTQAERTAISQLSSRVKPTAIKASFTYSYGDFPGDPKRLLVQYFDLMYYIANWGTQQLMFRLPKSLVDQKALELYCIKDCISLSFSGDWAILDWQFSNEEGFGWIEGEETLDELVGLRQEILEQDYRGLYLAWLKAITSSSEYVDIDLTQREPPIPNGLHQLSSYQKAFTQIFELDEQLLAVASTASTQPIIIADDTWQTAIALLSRSECEAFLLRLAKGESNLGAKLRQKLSKLTIISQAPSLPQRTIQQLLDAAFEQKEREARRLHHEAQAKQIQELQSLAPRKAQLWDEVELLIEKSQAKLYDQAVQLLIQLRDLAEFQHQDAAFQEKIAQISQKYSRRTGLIQRLRKAGL